ncbi:hypothetical protein BGP_1545 [Beggiatoa sp. PS]|nr:hypothetical protein BGP_1545 [Beggiatoa sp. PS]
MKIEVERVKKLVEQIIQMSQTEITKNEQLLINCLEQLEQEVITVQKQANGYPNSTITGGVWFGGAALASYGEALADYLSDKNLIEHEARATNLWAAAILSVCSHYHHLVGPAVVANAKIREKLGDLKSALQAYNAIVLDFECILEGCEEDDTKPFEEDLISIESLDYAVNRLIELEKVTDPNSKLLQIRERIRLVMENQITLKKKIPNQVPKL